MVQASEVALISRISDRYQLLGDWFLQQGEEIQSLKAIATQIKLIKRKMGDLDLDITLLMVCQWIVKAREYLELNGGVTLYNIPRTGYKIASPKECAIFSMKALKRISKLAVRTHRLADIVDQKHIPDAFEKVFRRSMGETRELASQSKEIMTIWRDIFGGKKKQITQGDDKDEHKEK